MLSVLLREMEEIRASQSKGGKIGKKGSLVLQLLVVRELPKRLRVMGVRIKRLRKILSPILRRGI